MTDRVGIVKMPCCGAMHCRRTIGMRVTVAQRARARQAAAYLQVAWCENLWYRITNKLSETYGLFWRK
jgi:hypothetical protein